VVTCQTYGYLPSSRATPPCDRYQIMLLDDRGTCEQLSPGMVTTQRNGRQSNRRPLSRNSDALTNAPPSHVLYSRQQIAVCEFSVYINGKVKCKFLPYSFPSIGPGADPGVQLTLSHPPGGMLPLHSARPAVTSVAFTRYRQPYTR